jgi:hypothetical protein
VGFSISIVIPAKAGIQGIDHLNRILVIASLAQQGLAISGFEIATVA